MSKRSVPVSFRPFQIKIFDRNGRSVYTESCGSRPTDEYLKSLLPLIFVKLLRKGKTDARDYTVAIIESNVTVKGKIVNLVKGV